MQEALQNAFIVVLTRNEKHLRSFDAFGNQAEEPTGVLVGSLLLDELKQPCPTCYQLHTEKSSVWRVRAFTN